MDYQDYKKSILEQMKSVLKPQGFRKTGSTFSASKNDVVWFVQLQSSTKTTRRVLVATVNIGIVSCVIAEKEGLKSKPSILDAHWRERIGSFLPKVFDKWWEIENDKEANQAGREIAEIIEKHALPQLFSLSTTPNLVRLWQRGRSPGLTTVQRERLLALSDK